jgi:hypothetical protein
MNFKVVVFSTFEGRHGAVFTERQLTPRLVQQKRPLALDQRAGVVEM